jgi:hypothetical protein
MNRHSLYLLEVLLVAQVVDRPGPPTLDLVHVGLL